MNGLGLFLIGCIIRGTFLALVGLAVGSVLGRRRPAVGAVVTLTTLMALLAVPLFALSPWPHWWTLSPGVASPETPAMPMRSSVEKTAVASAKPMNPEKEFAPNLDRPADTPWWTTFSAALDQELRIPAARLRAGGWRWPAWVAVGMLACLSFGLMRLLIGMRAVGALRRRSCPIDDQGLLDAVAIYRAEMSCTRPVVLLESADIATPATVGWRRPAILLPADWRGWDDQERRVVLSHELAHIGRGDYLSGLCAQLSVALNMYHPFAHWLAAQLRLQQELAADAWGATLSGGNLPYLMTLAQMALRQSEQPVTWPARPLLPARGTFLRRIEMLRDAKDIRHAPVTAKLHAITIGALGATLLFVAGFRSPVGAPVALAQGRGDAPAHAVDLVTLVPSDAVLMAAGHPAELLSRPEYKTLAEALDANVIKRAGLLLRSEEIEQVLAFWLPTDDVAPARPPLGNQPRGGRSSPLGARPGIMVRTTNARDWKTATAHLVTGPEEVAYQGSTYVRSTQQPSSPCYFTPDDHTLVLADEFVVRDMIRGSERAPRRHAWDRAVSGVGRGQLTVAADSAWLRRHMHLFGHDNFDPSLLTAFSPIWDASRSLALSADASGGLKLEALATCESAEDAKRVGATIQALLTLAKNTVEGLRHQVRTASRQQRAALEKFFVLADLFEPLLDKAEVKVDDAGEKSAVHLVSATEVKAGEVINAITPPILASRQAARRAQSVNNLKQIALAFHNYHSANGHFPPAVGLGPDGKTPHSWRVAILPYLDQQDLYNQYHFNEPWDGPHNRLLLDKIPAVYRYPGADNGPTFASYFVFTGPTTIFSDHTGTKIDQIRDGTSMTIVTVEAKRDIPWTKPEDIPFDPTTPLPEFGGSSPNGFNVGFADGSVRFVSNKVDPQVLRALITKASGEVISSDAF